MRALAGTGLVVRRVLGEDLERILRGPLSRLNAGERALRQYLSEEMCPGINRDYVALSFRKKNKVYMGFTLYPKTRQKSAKGGVKYRLAGIVTMGQFVPVGAHGSRPFKFRDLPEVNELVEEGRVRNMDLVCAQAAVAPPLTATVLMAAAIVDDMQTTGGDVYTMERAVHAAKSPIDGPAKRLGFTREAIVYTDKQVYANQAKGSPYERLVLQNPVKNIAAGLPEDTEVPWMNIGDVCGSDGCLQ